jgi:hypothetical protein
MKLRIGIYATAALLLAAHFLRAGNFVMVALCLAAPLLFFLRRSWSLIALQLLAYGAAGIWIAVAIQLVQMRQQTGQTWTAAAIILGSVALFSIAAGALLNSRTIKDRYPG